MTSFLEYAVFTAATFSCLAFAAPASLAPDSILIPVVGGKFANALLDLPVEGRSASASSTSTPSILMAPVSKANILGLPPLRRRAVAPITPQNNITIWYESSGATIIQAEINATMRNPSILLEDIESITKVDCSATSVDVTFSDQADYEKSSTTWPTSDFTLFTNHLGDCDTDKERGLYNVESLAFNATTLTITASTTKSTFHNSTDDMAISFAESKVNAANTTKREITQTFLGDFPGELEIVDNPVSKSLSIKVHDPALSGSLSVRGHLHNNFWHAKATSVTVSAFSIPGILDVGPMMEFELGVEVAASGTVDISADLTADISNGYIHLDFLNSRNTVSSGWKPVYTHQINISLAIEAQVNPFVALTAAIGVVFLGGVLDLSSGITARPEILNVFDIDSSFDISNSANVTMPASTDDNCLNGMWYSSAFVFIVSALVTQYYSLELYRLDVPLYESGCWTWTPEAIDLGKCLIVNI